MTEARKQYLKEWRKNNSAKISQYHKTYYEKNKETYAIKNKKAYSKNKKTHDLRTKKWRQENKFYIKDYENSPQVKIASALRHRIRDAVRKNYKSASTLELLGCDRDFLMSHLESQFKDSMSFDNYGEWHIDHIRPCASFDLTDPQQQKECFHYTNLQPLWAEENLSKGAKYDL